jgi:hypothetical protein
MHTSSPTCNLDESLSVRLLKCPHELAALPTLTRLLHRYFCGDQDDTEVRLR